MRWRAQTEGETERDEKQEGREAERSRDRKLEKWRDREREREQKISEETNEEIKPKTIDGKSINSPMVGTFYSSPNPGADSFVKVGDKVSEGDVLCIIEAMKMMNEVKSDYNGVIKEILISDAEPVEYGEALFIIEE